MSHNKNHKNDNYDDMDFLIGNNKKHDMDEIDLFKNNKKNLPSNYSHDHSNVTKGEYSHEH